MHISKLHYITTTANDAEQACRGGVDWIQLRLKNVTYELYKQVAIEVQSVCKAYKARLIINDNPQLALDIAADGVHLGKQDVSPAEARKLLGSHFMIGGTANTIEDIKALSNCGVDYIGLGPFRFTTTKQNLSPILGLEGYSGILNDIRNNNLVVPPIIGIGGVLLTDVASLLQVGLNGVAVSGSITNADDPAATATSFLEALNSNHQSNLVAL